ncbi:hypothetical protein [Mycolicibacterium vaccae]|uniref:FAD-dependent oxidoreductase 2 FAD binding domain-containing protein n=1 Tax=Mycolicibacterium vaccae ATCC 25954 TaxID=1194972 RepID=K0V5F1_MYCVA|nr:hypothetical protein [Mycolicibacterium vaccae]ANI39056.1 hypothetical protein MYVA_1865 [Mycolicibacterium vaccae 95051]EJZ09998.1 hypothetical protein MVAC_10937 [Mycolicibacterium vaccae ATCC 25954]MCV7064271.1 hypothetical protein [Mycolicibacterium vaccae]
MFCEPEWDDEVDVVVTGTGSAGLATAISAVEHDGDVFLAEAAGPDLAGGLHGLRRYFAGADEDGADEDEDERDEATSEYFWALTEDLDLTTLSRPGPDLPVRLMPETAPIRGRSVPPFEGWRLREWAAVCIPSPTGYLYTQVTDWTSTTMCAEGGEQFEITEIGVMSPDPDDPAGSVHRWLTAEADDRGLSPCPVRRLDRLVFDEGRVTGAVFATDEGPLTVRARHGVLVCDDTAGRGAPWPALANGTPLRVALVGKDASRFGRLEMLTADPAVAQSIPSPSAATVTTWRS